MVGARRAPPLHTLHHITLSKRHIMVCTPYMYVGARWHAGRCTDPALVTGMPWASYGRRSPKMQQLLLCCMGPAGPSCNTHAPHAPWALRRRQRAQRPSSLRSFPALPGRCKRQQIHCSSCSCCGCSCRYRCSCCSCWPVCCCCCCRPHLDARRPVLRLHVPHGARPVQAQSLGALHDHGAGLRGVPRREVTIGVSGCLRELVRVGMER